MQRFAGGRVALCIFELRTRWTLGFLCSAGYTHCYAKRRCMDSVISLIWRLFNELFRIGGPRRKIQEFALTRGFEYAETLDPTQLDLYAASFFGRFDVARDVITGVLDKTRFICFSHD